jgi:hypothetical protein
MLLVVLIALHINSLWRYTAVFILLVVNAARRDEGQQSRERGTAAGDLLISL